MRRALSPSHRSRHTPNYRTGKPEFQLYGGRQHVRRAGLCCFSSHIGIREPIIVPLTIAYRLSQNFSQPSGQASAYSSVRGLFFRRLKLDGAEELTRSIGYATFGFDEKDPLSCALIYLKP